VTQKVIEAFLFLPLDTQPQYFSSLGGEEEDRLKTFLSAAAFFPRTFAQITRRRSKMQAR
jgi:hypothetical protein